MLSQLRPLSHERAQSYVTWSKNEFFILGGSQAGGNGLSSRRDGAKWGGTDGRTGDKEGVGRVLTYFALLVRGDSFAAAAALSFT